MLEGGSGVRHVQYVKGSVSGNSVPCNVRKRGSDAIGCLSNGIDFYLVCVQWEPNDGVKGRKQ